MPVTHLRGNRLPSRGPGGLFNQCRWDWNVTGYAAPTLAACLPFCLPACNICLCFGIFLDLLHQFTSSSTRRKLRDWKGGLLLESLDLKPPTREVLHWNIQGSTDHRDVCATNTPHVMTYEFSMAVGIPQPDHDNRTSTRQGKRHP